MIFFLLSVFWVSLICIIYSQFLPSCYLFLIWYLLPVPRVPSHSSRLFSFGEERVAVSPPCRLFSIFSSNRTCPPALCMVPLTKSPVFLTALGQNRAFFLAKVLFSCCSCLSWRCQFVCSFFPPRVRLLPVSVLFAASLPACLLSSAVTPTLM